MEKSAEANYRFIYILVVRYTQIIFYYENGEFMTRRTPICLTQKLTKGNLF